jgi:uncharacterized protein (TIGR00730 family)
MAKLTSLCVYCGARPGADQAYAGAAVRLGRRLAEAGIRLVFGAGSVGLMGVVADAVIDAGGEAIGIIPRHLNRVELAHTRLTELIVVGSMHERKQKMFEMSDAFVVLPGGLGTLDETVEIITWKQLRLHDKPVIVVDQEGYWIPFLALVSHVIDHGFAPASSATLFTTVRDVDEVLDAIAASPEPKPAAPAALM